MIGIVLASVAIFLYATSSSISSSGGGSTISVTSTDRLIETGVCKLLNGFVPYEFHSITFNNNVTHYYVEFLPTSTNFTIISNPVTLSSDCPNPGPYFKITPFFSFYECTLDPTGTTFGPTPAQINSRFNYGLDVTTFIITNQFEYNFPTTAIYSTDPLNRCNCIPNTAEIEPRSLFSTTIDGFQISTSVYTSANVTSVRLVNKLRVLLPYINM